MAMLKLVIKRSKWLRGEGGDCSYLLRKSDKKMCCLGFLALACGYTRKNISGYAEPTCLVDNKFPLGLIDEKGRSTPKCNSLMDINDSETFTDSVRELELKILFKKINVRVQFVD